MVTSKILGIWYRQILVLTEVAQLYAISLYLVYFIEDRTRQTDIWRYEYFYIDVPS